MIDRDGASRRRFLVGAGVAFAAAATNVPAAVRGGREFDTRDPRANVRALVKLQGSLDGRPGVTFTSGKVLRTRHGELAQTLVGFERCQVRVFRQLPDGRYACAKHNWMMSTDPATGVTKPAPSFVVRNTPMLYGPEGYRWTKIHTEREVVASPFRIAWQRVGEEDWATVAHTLRTPQQGRKLGVETASTTMHFRWDAFVADTPACECGVSDLLQVDE